MPPINARQSGCGPAKNICLGLSCPGMPMVRASPDGTLSPYTEQLERFDEHEMSCAAPPAKSSAVHD